MIVKIQMPLATNDPNPKALVYNEKRDFTTFMKITEELLEVMNEDIKAFFEVTYEKKNDNIILGNRLSNQEW